MSELSDEQRIIRRALSLMQNGKAGWSKALAIAADSVKKEPTTNRATIASAAERAG